MTNPSHPKAPPPPVAPVARPPAAGQGMDEVATAVSGSGLPRFLTVMLGVVLTLGALLLMREYSGVIGPVFMAVNLVIAAYPIQEWLRTKGTPGWLSASVMFLTVTVILLAALAGLVWAVSAMVSALPNYSSQWMALYDQVMRLLGSVGINTTGVGDLMQQVSPSSLVGFLSTAFSYGTAVTGVTLTIVLSLIFIAMDTPGMRSRLKVGAQAHPDLAKSMSAFVSSVRTYWVGTTVFGAIIAVLDGLALFIMGVPLAVVWALLSFLTNYIPNVGFAIGLIPPVLLALLGSGWQLAVGVIVVYSVLNFVIQTVIQPRIVGESVGVTPTVSFVSLLLWGMVLGGLGTLIALPMTLLLKAVFIDTDPKARWLGALISTKTPGGRPRPAGQAPPRPAAAEKRDSLLRFVRPDR